MLGAVIGRLRLCAGLVTLIGHILRSPANNINGEAFRWNLKGRRRPEVIQTTPGGEAQIVAYRGMTSNPWQQTDGSGRDAWTTYALAQWLGPKGLIQGLRCGGLLHVKVNPGEKHC
jgi:hypothetical protein